MCGRYGFTASDTELSERFAIERIDFELRESFNVSPTHEMPLVERHSPNSLHLREWGIYPGFMNGRILINAKADKLATSPVWKKAFVESRCIVPANYFYEWQLLENGKKQPYLIRLKNKELMGFAGLVVTTKDHKGQEHTGYVIVTTDPNPLLKKIHNVKERMPVILRKEDEDTWLNPDNTEPEVLNTCLIQYPESLMEAYPVSDAVSKTRNNYKELTDPLTE